MSSTRFGCKRFASTSTRLSTARLHAAGRFDSAGVLRVLLAAAAAVVCRPDEDREARVPKAAAGRLTARAKKRPRTVRCSIGLAHLAQHCCCASLLLWALPLCGLRRDRDLRICGVDGDLAGIHAIAYVSAHGNKSESTART